MLSLTYNNDLFKWKNSDLVCLNSKGLVITAYLNMLWFSFKSSSVYESDFLSNFLLGSKFGLLCFKARI